MPLYNLALASQTPTNNCKLLSPSGWTRPLTLVLAAHLQVQQYVSDLLLPHFNHKLSLKVQGVLNNNLEALQYEGTYKL